MPPTRWSNFPAEPPIWRPFPQNRTDSLFAHLVAIDPRGHAIQTALGGLAMVVILFPTTWTEWAGLPLLVAGVTRLTEHHRILGPLFRERSFQALFLLVTLALASRYWSLDRHAGLIEAGAWRFAMFVPLLWMILTERRWLIIAMIAGFAFTIGSQATHAIGHAMSIEWLTWNRLPGRNSGWHDPVVGGSLLVAGLGLQLPALLVPRSRRERICGTVGVVAVMIAIFATGTRGAMLAAIALIPAGSLLLLLRTRALRARSAAIATVCGLMLAVLIGAAAWMASPGLRDRISTGIQETRAALQDGDASSYTGARVKMAAVAVRAFADSPVWGVGAGGYRAWAERDAAGQDGRGTPVHSHAHNWFLHTAATLGLLGLSLTLYLLWRCVWCGLRDSDRGYDAGPPVALLGLALVGAFDTIHVNSQTACMLCVLVALCLPIRPGADPGPSTIAAS